MSILLFIVGYPVAIAVIVRWVPVVRERRTSWFISHQLAVAAIVAGHALRENSGGVVVNGAWLVIAAAWYGLAHLSRRRRP